MNFDLIEKYLRGDASEEERIQVMLWAEENDANRNEFAALRKIYDATLLMDNTVAVAGRGRMSRYLKWIAAAAAVIIVAGISYFTGSRNGSDGSSLQFYSLSAPVGQQTKTMLSDGTVIWLNSGSEVEICSGSGEERKVKLKGEAYLDVAKDSLRPFIVETSKMKIKVLGTQFNVNAYDETQSVVLISGSVNVTGLDNGETSRIRPDEMYTYDSVTGKSCITTVDSKDYISWTEGFMKFKGAMLSQVLDNLHNFYGIDIRYNPAELGDATVSGKLELRNGIESALKSLKSVVAISYRYSDDGTIDIQIE